MPKEKTILEFEKDEICYSTSRDSAKCVVIRQEGQRVLVIDDPTLLNAKNEPIPTWYPVDKLRAPVKGEEGFKK
jgi:hypothetical protein